MYALYTTNTHFFFFFFGIRNELFFSCTTYYLSNYGDYRFAICFQKTVITCKSETFLDIFILAKNIKLL